MDAAASPLQSLIVPVNSAVYWSHLYVVDDDEPDRLIDLTSTSSPVDLRDPVPTSA